MKNFLAQTYFYAIIVPGHDFNLWYGILKFVHNLIKRNHTYMYALVALK
jgi:hypothetical protein